MKFASITAKIRNMFRGIFSCASSKVISNTDSEMTIEPIVEPHKEVMFVQVCDRKYRSVNGRFVLCNEPVVTINSPTVSPTASLEVSPLESPVASLEVSPASSPEMSPSDLYCSQLIKHRRYLAFINDEIADAEKITNSLISRRVRLYSSRYDRQKYPMLKNGQYSEYPYPEKQAINYLISAWREYRKQLEVEYNEYVQCSNGSNENKGLYYSDMYYGRSTNTPATRKEKPKQKETLPLPTAQKWKQLKIDVSLVRVK